MLSPAAQRAYHGVMRFFRNRLEGAEGAEPRDADAYVSLGMRVAGAWSWRIIVVAGVLALFCWTVATFSFLVIPLMVSVLIAALLSPAVDGLQRLKVPRVLAVAIMLLGLIAVVTSLMWVAVSQIRAGYSTLQEKAVASWEDLKQWLLESPLHVTDEDINRYLGDAAEALQSDIGTIFSSALSFGTSVGGFLTGVLLALFASIFVLYDGKGIWRWLVGILPLRARVATDKSARLGWATVGNFVRVQALVAAIDAVGIGLGMWILSFVVGEIPLIIPVAILVFLGSFIPVIGAVLTGALATVIVLVTVGFWPAVVMLGIVILVQQIESHVLQPIIMGSAVKIHPLAVVFAVSGGSIVAGLAGAVLAVPVVAFVNVFIKSLANGNWRRVPADGLPVIPSQKQSEQEQKPE